MWWSRQSRQAAKLLDRERPKERLSTRDVIAQVDDWSQKLTAALERAERLAPLLLADDETGGEDA